ncbi:MAG: extracellular solute-binding protein [Oscillospiraceae bacterium]|nr:extracellular solute-binding protein [Oscillospiraceae bacterium]
MKKRLALLMALVMMFSLCCFSAPAAFADDEVTLTLWSIATESDSSHQAFVDGIAAFEAEHPGVKIEHVTTENEAYKTKIKAAMSSGEGLPDIFFTWGMGFLGEFVNAGRVYCVDDDYANYADELPEAMTVNVRYDGKMYGVPYTMSLVTLYANMDLLAQVGYDDIPATYEDMIDCCEALKAAGIIPFGVSGKELWCLSEYVEPLVIKSVGGQALRDMYNGEASWNNEGVVKAIEAFEGMVENEYFDPSAAALGNDEVKNNFIAGKYAFYQNGSWNNKDIGEQAQFNVKAGTFPVLDDSIPLYSMIGGPNNTLAVTESSQNKELAVEAAFFLAKFMSDADYKSGANLPCWAADPDAEVNDLIQAAADMASKAEDMVLFGDNFLSADAANTYLDYIGLAYAGDVTPTEYVEGLDADLG